MRGLQSGGDDRAQVGGHRVGVDDVTEPDPEGVNRMHFVAPDTVEPMVNAALDPLQQGR
jgi:hypothetical protein